MHVLSVNVGRAEPLRAGERTVLSGIVKRPQPGRVSLRPLGLEGDEQADPSTHGGLAKAVYAYPSEHLPFWRTVRAQAGVAGWNDEPPPGLLGENLTLSGLVERDDWVGDILRFPDAELVISEPRLPCFKLDAVLGFPKAVKLMAESGWCGFYLAVGRAGSLQAGEPFEWVPGPREVGVAELFRARMTRNRSR